MMMIRCFFTVELALLIVGACGFQTELYCPAEDWSG